jgi:hypothetical protein
MKTMVQFGCGGNILPGWRNHDMEVDITKPLPYGDNSVSRIYIEHCLEHVNSAQMLGFMKESLRILEPGGAIRIVFPDCMRILALADDDYIRFIESSKWSVPGAGATGTFLAIGSCHGHQQLLTPEIVTMALISSGFNCVKSSDLFHSSVPEFCNICGHWKVIGKHFFEIESVAMEAFK